MKVATLHIIAALGFVLASCGNIQHGTTVDRSNPNLRLENGVLSLDGTPFTGQLVAYHENGSLSHQAEYSQGRKQGVETKWYADGQLKEEREYQNGIKFGTHKGWWENGLIKFTYEFNESGLYEGSRCEWYVSGQLFREFNYVNGEEVGSQKLWTKTGKIKGNYEVDFAR